MKLLLVIATALALVGAPAPAAIAVTGLCPSAPFAYGRIVVTTTSSSVAYAKVEDNNAVNSPGGIGTIIRNVPRGGDSCNYVADVDWVTMPGRCTGYDTLLGTVYPPAVRKPVYNYNPTIYLRIVCT